MSNERLGPVRGGDADWDQAIRFVLRLARARRTMMHDRGATKTASTDDALAEATLAGANDIERASAALRSVQPDLEIWRDGAAMPRRSRHSPAWLAIGVVWVSTLVFIGLAAAGVTILVR